MPIWKNTQHSFAAGQLDAHVMGRQDMERYFKGATLLKNFLVKRQGCISKRRGTDLTANLDGLLGTTHDGTPIMPGKMRLVPVTNGDDGRYLILSGGLAFVADRDGLLMTDNSRVRSVPTYVGQDAYGRKTISGGNDRMYNPSLPIELIHVVAPGVYENSRYSSIADAFADAQDGDTIRLHDDLMMANIGGWVLEDGTALNMSYDRAMRMWMTTIGVYTRYSDVVDESSDVVYFSTPGMYAYRIQLVQKGFTAKSNRWTYSDGRNWAISRYSNGIGGWKITDGTHTYQKDGGTEDDVSVIIPSRVVACTRVNTSSTWTFSDGQAWTIEWVLITQGNSRGWGWRLTKGDETYSKFGGSSSDTSVTFELETVTCTRQRTHVILDLYGYTMTFNASSQSFDAGVCMDLSITSQRLGAKVVCVSTGNWGAFDSSKNGTITVDGGITWQCIGESYGSFLRTYESSCITINSGMFKRSVAGQGPLVEGSSTSTLCINGGTFETKSRRLGSTMANCIVKGDGVVVNGGDFFVDAPANDSSYVFENGTLALNVLGGRFRTSGCHFFLRITTVQSVSRGLFSRNTYMSETCATGIENTLDGIKSSESVLNETSPDEDGFYGVKLDGEGDYAWNGVVYNSTLYRIAVPYADDDLADLCIRQSGDTIFIAHRDYPPAKITFSSKGFAFFDEIAFDNTDHRPPEITSCVMEGQGEKETDEWPEEFTTPPSWLDNTQKAAVTAFKNACKALGTVTNAGFSGNKADGSDGSCSYACSYTCTIVSKDYDTGKKTTTVRVKSFTQSITKEVTTEYTDGLATGSSTRTITTPGSAENSASATSVITTRTVRYVATYVKDGQESRPSNPVAVDYDMPWANSASVKIRLSRGRNDTEPDYYNVYKDNGAGYGLIATVGTEKAITTLEGYIDTYRLYMPVAHPSRLQNVYDWEESKGWSAGSVIKRILSGRQKEMSSSTGGDVALVSTTSNASNGIVVEMTGEDIRFKAVSVSLDGRMYDAENDVCYLIPSYSRVRCTLTYVDAEGTRHTSYKVTQPSKKFGVGATSFVDWPAQWQGKNIEYFTAPNGDTVVGLLLGEGDQSDLFNATMRRLTFDFSDVYAQIDHVTRVAFTFTDTYYSSWINTQTQRQGVIRGITFTNSTFGTAASAADVSDDYINPDMTVTPPNDQYDPHFGETDAYPGCVGIYEQRLVFASTRSSPSTIWMSRVADLYNFTSHDSIREDDALELTLAATEFPAINHLVMGRDLMLFGDGGEWLVSPVSGNALTYKTASAKLQSMIGSDRELQPLQLADETLFAERGGSCLRTINYNYTSDSYQSQDLSVIAQSIFRANPIVSMAYKQHPDSIVECVLMDGRVGTLVYMKEQEVAAWSVQELGGGWKAREIVTPKCIVDGTTEMMLLVEKAGVYQLWKVRNDNDAHVDTAQVILDGMHIETSSAPTGTGEMGVALGDGTYAIGWPVVSEFVSVRPEPEKGATAQMEIKNATESEIRVIDASTFSVKPYAIETGWREVTLPVARSGSAVTLAEKDCKRLLTGTNNRDGRIHVRHAEPWPLTILSISNTYQIEYENEEGKGDGQ